MLLRNTFTRDARVLKEARSLAAAGHDVTVLAVQAGSLPREEVVNGFRVLRAVEAQAWMGPTILGTGAEGPAVVAGARGIPGGRLGTFAHRFARPPAAVIARDVALERMFRQAARTVPSDVLHAHDLNTLGAAASVARERDVPLVYDAHELYPDLTGLSPLERRRWSAQEERLIRDAAVVIAPTFARAEVLATRYEIPLPTVVMNCPDPPPDGLDDDRLEALRRPGERLAVYAGGFTPNRGLANLIVAAGLLETVRLALLGWGPLEEELRALAAPYGDQIVFVGSVEPDLVVPACRHADIGIVSYEPIGLNNELAAPNKLFEYLHAGLAIAGSDLPDVRRVVEAHEVGVTFDAGSPASIRAALERLGSEDLTEMRRQARAAAPAYTWAAQAETLLALYAGLGA